MLPSDIHAARQDLQVLQARRPQRMLERQWIINRSGGWLIGIVVDGEVQVAVNPVAESFDEQTVTADSGVGDRLPPGASDALHYRHEPLV